MRINLPSSATFRQNRLIPKATPASAQAFQNFALQATMRFLRKFSHVQRISNAMHCDEQFALLMPGVNALRHSDYTNAVMS